MMLGLTCMSMLCVAKLYGIEQLQEQQRRRLPSRLQDTILLESTGVRVFHLVMVLRFTSLSGPQYFS